MKIWSKARALVQRSKTEVEMSEEIRLHLELQTERNLAAGMNADEARYAARRQFGGVEQIKEQCREQRSWVWLEQSAKDVCHAFRGLIRRPGFSMIAVLTFSLGIGLVTIQFSLVSGVLFQGLPFERSERIMLVERVGPAGRERTTPLGDYAQWRDRQRSFGELASYRREAIELSEAHLGARSYRGAAFTADVLPLLRTRPLLGRGFVAEDERSGAPLVLLLGYEVWLRDFGGDSKVVGRAVRIRGESARLIGVMPPGFGFPRNESIWINLRLPPAGGTRGANAATGTVIGRLRDDTTLEKARAEFDLLTARTEAAREPDAAKRMRPEIRPLLQTLNPTDITVLLLSLLAVALGVLALACLNVANLLSARALQRGQEIAVRVALGGARGRIVRLMLAESVVLAAAGALGGLLIAMWAVPLLNGALIVPNRPFWVKIAIDFRVLAATAGLTLAVGLLAGLIPAMRATRDGAGTMLRDVLHGTSNAQLGRLNQWLVTAQVGLSCAVLMATSVLVDGMRQRSEIDLPFEASRVLSADLRLGTPELQTATQREAFQRSLLSRLIALPGVDAAALTATYPFGAGSRALDIRGQSSAGGAPWSSGFVNAVSPEFFGVLHLSLRAGRGFTNADRRESERVAVVSESFARRVWPNESALGQQVRERDDSATAAGAWLTVVGVVTDLNVDAPDFRPGVYVPFAQQPPTEAVAVLSTQGGDVHGLARPLREEVRRLAPEVPVDRVLTLRERMEDDFRLLTAFGWLATAFGVSALLLATVGVYGVTSYAVQRRTHEIGVRMALGARPAEVLQLVVGRGLRQSAMGFGAGGLLGWAISRPLQGLLVEVQGPMTWPVCALAGGMVAATLGFALWWPARRAAKVDPMVALRCE